MNHGEAKGKICVDRHGGDKRANCDPERSAGAF